MRAREFIVEKQEFKISQQVSIPNVSHVGVPGNPQGPTNYYHKYRLGVAMAASPDFEHEYPVNGEFVEDMVMVAYSEADVEIVNRAYTKFGYHAKKLSTKGSQEMKDTYVISPVCNWNKNAS